MFTQKTIPINQSMMRYLSYPLLIIFLVFFCSTTRADLPAQNLVTPENKLKRNALIIYSGNSKISANVKIREGLLAQLESAPENAPVELFEEYLDDLRLKITDSYSASLIALLKQKYGQMTLNRIVTVGPSANNLCNKYPDFFPNVPRYDVSVAGLYENNEQFNAHLLKALNTPLQLLPNINRLVVIVGKGNAHLAQSVKEIESLLLKKVQLDFWDNFNFEELYNQVEQLPKNTAILYYPVGIDNLGNRQIPFNVFKKLNQISPVPIFVDGDTYLNFGTVGGYLRSLKQEGDMVGRIILGFDVPQDTNEFNKEFMGYFFDDKQLKRWKISYKNLPPNSTIINREESIFYTYRWYLAAMLFVILSESVLIGWLIHSLRHRKIMALELADERNLLEMRVKERTNELEESRALFQDAVSVAKFGVFNYDLTTSELYWDDSMFAIYGLDPQNRNLVYEVWQHAVLPEDLPKAEYELQTAITEHKAFDTRFRIQRPDGIIRTVHALAQFYRDKNGTPLRLVGINQDVTEREEAEAIIHNLAYCDPLTQLPNRRLLSERLKQLISSCHRENKQFAVMMMDLDKFKAVNDTLGHAAGDELLVQVAERIKARLREYDLVARLGGDEFVIVLSDVHSPDDTKRVANALIATLTKIFKLSQSDNVQIGTSIGITFYPQHGEDGDVLIDKADTALYKAKNNGRGCFAYYEGD